jgi:precorrin-6B methylase 1
MTSFTCILKQIGGNRLDISSTAADVKTAISATQAAARAAGWKTTKVAVIAIMLENGEPIAKFRSMAWHRATVELRKAVSDVFWHRKNPKT